MPDNESVEVPGHHPTNRTREGRSITDAESKQPAHARKFADAASPAKEELSPWRGRRAEVEHEVGDNQRSCGPMQKHMLADFGHAFERQDFQFAAPRWRRLAQ